MKLPQALLFILAAIGAMLFVTFGTSCKTLDDPSPHTQKVRADDNHMDIIRRRQRRNRN